MVGKDFEVGDLVWARMKSFPPWPSRIVEHPDGKTKKAHHYVYFFGSKNFAWIPDEKISPHNDKMIETHGKKKSAQLQEAIEEIVDESKKSPPKKERLPVQEHDDTITVKSKSNNLKKKKEVKLDKTTTQKRKETPKKISKKRSAEINGGDYESPLKKKLNFGMTDKSASSYVQVPESYPSLPSSILQRSEYIERPATPPLNIEEVRETLLAKNVKPTTKKIGFLGLGALGRGIVKNLLNSGHDVIVWNRSPRRCDAFQQAGAHTAKTPADVIEMCDITFSCVSDPHTTKTLIFGNYGVLRGLEGCTPLAKGYVEMTGIDPETSQEIAKEICSKGGRYMEAPVNGSRSLAEDGQLLVLAAGDRELFQACQSCFSAFSKHAYFVSLEVGHACRMSLILSMFKGSVIAALAEALTLIHRCKLSPENFLSILDLGSVGSQLLREKGQAMSKRNYVSDVALKHQQKDLTLALSLANTLQQPLQLAAAANEMYKRAKLRCYEHHDVSAVVEGIRQ